jgi:radical SAM superfamily enzyme YgiQ (UPF0313 family)
MKKILLINPPPTIASNSDFRFQNVPLSLVYVGGYARKLGFEVRIIDAYNELLKPRQVLEAAAAYKPDIVGITCDATRLDIIKLLYRHLREMLPDALFVAGGSLPSFRQEDLLPWVDVIVKGEGEASFGEVITNFAAGRGFEGVRGVYVRKDGAYVFNGEREPILDLDNYFFPAWDLVDTKHNFFFWGRTAPVATLVTSRGCPENCAYCAVHALWGHRHRQLSAGRTLDELQLLHDRYGVREIYFKDNLFTFDKRWVRDLCEGLLARKLKLSWSCGTGVKYMSPEILALMKKAGCHTVNVGFESGNQEILDRMNKNVTVEQNLKAAEMLHAAGINIFAFFMMGYPGETREQVEDTIRLARKISPFIMMCAMVTPFPGTRLWYDLGYDKAEKDDWGARDYNWYHRSSSLSPVPAMELERLRAHAMRSVRTWRYWLRYILGGNPHMLARQVWRMVWTYRIHFSPKYRGIRKDIPKGVF